MNKDRRNRIATAISELEALLNDKIADIRMEIESLRDEEQEAFDNLPESLQYAERGQAMEEAINNLDYALDALGEDIFQEAIENLNSAAE
ncbi:MAG: hypothetical protein EBT13_07275 [Rhodobacteraceae bacterium]|nr:hypothetical protein [Paracoccaceae bacterium]